MTSPLPLFAEWLAKAKAMPAITEPTAMCLATVGEDGQPSARIVLLKAFDEHGFVFYTNFESRKSEELKANARAALCFYWMALDKQVRIEGLVEPVSAAEADAYFASRMREKQIGAWASAQSRPLTSREELVKKVEDTTRRFAGKPVPRPPHWSGWRVIPERVEFWSQGEFRLHDRAVFIREKKGWREERLWP